MLTIPRVLRSMAMIPFATSAASLITRPLPNAPDIIEGEFTVIPPKERTKFIHLRFHFPETRHARNEAGISNRGGATLAYKRSADRTSFSYAFALCNIKDNFCRYTGRAVAQGYLESENGWTVPCDIHSPDSRYIEDALVKLNAKTVSTWSKIYTTEAVNRLKNTLA